MQNAANTAKLESHKTTTRENGSCSANPAALVLFGAGMTLAVLLAAVLL